jgi:hypothetical protein
MAHAKFEGLVAWLRQGRNVIFGIVEAYVMFGLDMTYSGYAMPRPFQFGKFAISKVYAASHTVTASKYAINPLKISIMACLIWFRVTIIFTVKW